MPVSVMYNYKGEFIHTELMDYIPAFSIGMTIDIMDEHYEITKLIYQPYQRRYKIFLEKI